MAAAAYVPYRRLARSEIAAFMGSGGGRGTRAVASHDEDTTTMGVEAARAALRSTPNLDVEALWFTTATPAYLDKDNAATIHAALRLAPSVPAFDFGGALRSGLGAVLAALSAAGTTLVVTADRRDGLPTSTDEAFGGDAAAALAVADGTEGAPLLAELVATASITDEVMDRWRSPGEARSKVWEERFGETRYLDLGRRAWAAALQAAGVGASEVAQAVVTGMHGRAVRSLGGRLGLSEGALADDLGGSVGQAGCAHPALALVSLLEAEAGALRRHEVEPGRLLCVLQLADGADVVMVRTTEALADWVPARPLADQLAAGAELPYAKFLAWRGMLHPEPPRRPEPQRVSSPAAWRSEAWKFGFVGSRDRSSGAIHLPPARASMKGGAVDDMEPVPMAEATGKVVTFTVDRLAYSPSPPIVFAVVDFDQGGRFPLELTDVDAETLGIGDPIEMTFRRLFTADGIHDYFWKGRPATGAADGPGAGAPSIRQRAGQPASTEGRT